MEEEYRASIVRGKCAQRARKEWSQSREQYRFDSGQPRRSCSLEVRRTAGSRHHGERRHRSSVNTERRTQETWASHLWTLQYTIDAWGGSRVSGHQGKAEISLAKLEANVPLEKQKRTGSIVEIVEGVDNEKEIDEDMIGEKGRWPQTCGLQRSNDRLLAELSKSDTKIADLTAELARANKALRINSACPQVPAPSGNLRPYRPRAKARRRQDGH